MSLERGQAGTEVAGAGNGVGRWEAAAQRGARPKHHWPFVPVTPGWCWHVENWERGWLWQGPGRDFAGSVRGLGETGQVWKRVGVWREGAPS